MAYCSYYGPHGTTASRDYCGSFSSIVEKEEKARRQKKKIDRISQKAEAAQRLAKRGSWK